MGKVIYSLIQVLIFAIAGVLVSTNPAKQDKITPTSTTPSTDASKEVVKNWPKIFALSTDPNDPIVCYSGIRFNFTGNENKTAPQEEKKKQVFTLSEDPLYPVTCRRGPVPENLADILAVVEDGNGGNATNVTYCIRRDYEKNVSAIFLHQAGPLDTALYIFNSTTVPYKVINYSDTNTIDQKKVLKEYIVDCLEYGIDTGDKGLCPGLAASLCG